MRKAEPCTESATFKAAVEKLFAALTDERGHMIPIGRIEFEPVGRQVRWTIHGASTGRMQTMTGSAADIYGFCKASQMLLEIELGRADQTAPPRHEEHEGEK